MVFWGDESIASTLEILRAQEVASTDDEVDKSKKEKNEDALIDFGHVH